MFKNHRDSNGLVYYYVSKESHPSSRILFMDLDSTLITPKSGKKLPIDNDDWKYLIDPKLLLPYLAA